MFSTRGLAIKLDIQNNNSSIFGSLISSNVISFLFNNKYAPITLCFDNSNDPSDNLLQNKRM